MNLQNNDNLASDIVAMTAKRQFGIGLGSVLTRQGRSSVGTAGRSLARRCPGVGIEIIVPCAWHHAMSTGGSQATERARAGR
jgi:hypothetical protein